MIDLAISDKPTAEETDAVLQGLIVFNELNAGPASARELTVIARRGDEIVAGLIGFTQWNWMFVRLLWVSEAHRRQGLGRRILLAAENEARSRGCEHVHLDTFSFQAAPFYERQGYTEFGRLDDYPPGHSRIYLQKRNLAQ